MSTTKRPPAAPEEAGSNKVAIGKISFDRRVIAGYCRVNSLHHESLNEQMCAINEFSKLETNQAPIMFTDLGSDNSNRRKLVLSLTSGDILICTALHRYSSNLIDTITEWDDLLSRNVRVYLTSDTTCLGNFDVPAMARLRQAIGGMASWEKGVRHG